MTPQEAEKIILNAIKEVKQKAIAEAEEEGWEYGWKKGWKKGEAKAKEEIAKSLKEILPPEEIAKHTGLNIEQIKEL